MANKTIQLPSMGVVEAENRIREIFDDIFGPDDVRKVMFEGSPIIKSKSYGEKVKITREGPGTVVDVSDARGTVESRINALKGQDSSDSVEDRRGTEEGSEVYGGEAMREIENGAETFDDGSVRFKPEFTKAEADYVWPTDKEYDRDHSKCRSCAHFIEGGGCHVVQGDIDKEGYCEELYADVGAYGHRHENFVEQNLMIYGLEFDWAVQDIDEFLTKVKDKMEEKMGT